MSASAGSTDGDMGFQIAPMVDVVFVLMLFFMASAGQQISEKELNISLANRNPSGSLFPTPISPVLIDISAEGQVMMNSQPFGTPADHDLPALRAWLKNSIAQFGDRDPVIIRPSPQARHERIMDVLNAAQAAHIATLSFQ